MSEVLGQELYDLVIEASDKLKRLNEMNQARLMPGLLRVFAKLIDAHGWESEQTQLIGQAVRECWKAVDCGTLMELDEMGQHMVKLNDLLRQYERTYGGNP